MSTSLPLLRHFVFKHAFGSIANDGDMLLAHIPFTDRADLEHKFSKMGISLQKASSDVPHQSVIREFPEWAQPCHVKIAGYKVFVWVYQSNIEISVSGSKDGNSYEVSEVDYAVCVEVEKVLDRINEG